jgi:hypothetical protein
VGVKAPAPAPVHVAARPAPRPAPVKTVVKTVTRTVGVPVKPATPADPGIMVIRGTTTTFVNR